MANGERWVTINGHHVLIGSDGIPVNKADQKLPDSAKRNSTGKGSKTHYDKIKEWEHKFETAETTEDIDRLQDEINDYTRDVLNKDNTLDDKDRNHLESRMRDLYKDTNRRKESFEGKNTEPSYEYKKQYLKDKGLTKQVKELNTDGNNEKAAVEYVYDQNTLSKEDFDKKYGVTEGMRKTKSAVFKNDPSKGPRTRMADVDIYRQEEPSNREYSGKQKGKNYNTISEGASKTGGWSVMTDAQVMDWSDDPHYKESALKELSNRGISTLELARYKNSKKKKK